MNVPCHRQRTEVERVSDEEKRGTGLKGMLPPPRG